MVTPESSFEQTMMGSSTQCYIPSFMERIMELKLFLYIILFENYGRIMSIFRKQNYTQKTH